MNKRTYMFFTSALLLLTFAFCTGCGKYLTQYSAPYIVSSQPAIGATGIVSTETLWVKFNKSMDGAAIDVSALGSKLSFPQQMTAVPTFFADTTPEVYWSENATKLTITGVNFISGEGSRVYIVATREGFMDANGLYLPENTVMWDYTLAP
jgi:Bacterial Ig-like domain